MNSKHISTLSRELSLAEHQVNAVAELLNNDATIPFIARYRKEVTGSLDEVIITEIRNRLNQLKELDDRKESILKSLDKNGHLNDELQAKVESAETLSVLEDIYLPFKPKRRTKATIAREKGLEPLALKILEQAGDVPHNYATDFINEESGVTTIEEAISGAQDIIAEMISENEDARAGLRHLFMSKGYFTSNVIEGKEDDGKKYKDYFNWSEPVSTAPSHRVLAMRRGEKEDILNVSTLPPEDQAIHILQSRFIKATNDESRLVDEAIKDSYKRLLSRSMETEIRVTTKDRADIDAIRVFSENLRQLLMAPPLGPKRIMGIDPGFRTGCKIVCLDRQGKLLDHDTIYPNMNPSNDKKAEATLKKLCSRHTIEAIAIGNGTAGRETEAFIKTISFDSPVQIILVNESGASIYSASDVAREEFPDLDLTVRGAISIGRRLMDPLSELVKIDPKSIGVGQYQHDVDQTLLKQELDDVVVSCVNSVGVDVNRASSQLLTYVSGLGPGLAKNIVKYRNENGPFKSRKHLTNVPRLGPKAFEQSAGFLRIHDGDVPLDGSAVHPESYHIVEQMAADIQCGIPDLLADDTLRRQIDIHRYETDTIGIPTLTDILNELAKPGRDPRDSFQEFSFAQGIDAITDLEPGMKLPGIVTNITAFGAFVDIGVHQDGLVHISEMSDTFVKDPSSIVKVHQAVKVRVIDVDIERKRISLSMKSGRAETPDGSPSKNKKAAKQKPASRTINRQRNPKPMKKDTTKGGSSPFNNPFADAFKNK